MSFGHRGIVWTPLPSLRDSASGVRCVNCASGKQIDNAQETLVTEKNANNLCCSLPRTLARDGKKTPTTCVAPVTHERKRNKEI
jgi:hypothetical protein